MSAFKFHRINELMKFFNFSEEEDGEGEEEEEGDE